MDQVIGVSWPGSGHRLLVGMLRDYFGPKLIYSGNAAGVSQATQDEGALSLLANDSLGMFGMQAGNLRYLIQYRGYESWVVSAYDRMLASLPGQMDSLDLFSAFVSRNFTPYRAFMDRWIHPEASKTQLALSYEQLVHYPQESLRLAIWWLDHAHEINQTRLQETIAAAGIRTQSPPEEFRYYDRELFEKIARLSLTREEIRAVCLSLLGREPAERMWLDFQAHASVSKMIQVIRASSEYKRRMQARP